MGVTCAADADVAAPLTVCGSGVYVGGSLRGRENVAFVAGAGRRLRPPPTASAESSSRPPPCTEERASSPAASRSTTPSALGEFPDDSDRHAGVRCPGDMAGRARRPSSSWRRDARRRRPEQALQRGSPDGWIGRRRPRSTEQVGGRCLLLPRWTRSPSRARSPADAGRLLVDRRRGRRARQSWRELSAFSGGLVVCGRLRRARACG